MKQIYLTKISSKNQLTLPVDLLREFGWQKGQTISIQVSASGAKLVPVSDPLQNIVKISQKYNFPTISVEEAIEQTKLNNKSKFDYEL